jgi:hypothetical protein
MAVSHDELLAAVERSPEAVGAHDREGWVALFTADASVEDPAGSRPHRGRTQIEHFYDTFIGPRDITFRRDTDVVSGSTVVRGVTLEVRMGASVTMTIPAYLRYDLDDTLNIARLQAFWELPTMLRQFARNGVAAVPVGLRLSGALLRNQGLRGTAGFLTGFRGATSRGKRHLAALLDDAVAGDQIAVKRRLADSAQITRGDVDRIGTSELVALLHGGRWDGMIRSGYTVAARVRRDGRRLIVFGELETRPTRIRAVRVFADDLWT